MSNFGDLKLKINDWSADDEDIVKYFKIKISLYAN
jgi:hypothetical protein